MLERLSHIRYDMFADPQVQQVMAVLLNAIETQQKQLEEQKQIIQALRDELAKLKGGNAKPKITPNTKPDISSQKNIDTKKNWTKESKKDKMTFDNTTHCKLDKTHLPTDLVYKGTRTVVSQDIIFQRNNTQYIVEIWYSPSENKTYQAPLPADYTGYFGNSLKAFCIIAHRALDVTRNKLLKFLSSIGITMSDGGLQDILTQDKETWVREKYDLLRNGLKSLFTQTDSTSAKVHGQNYRTHIFVSEFFTVFATMPTKSRLDILRALQGEPESLSLRYNDTALNFFEHYHISPKDKAIIENVFAQNKTILQSDFKTIIEEQYPKLAKKVTTYKWIVESLAFGYYFEQTEFKAPDILLSDDAKEYMLLALTHALCWVHDARYYNKLSPILDCHSQILEKFKERYWDYYSQLKKYTQNPSLQQKEELNRKFDELFVANSGYFDLDKEIERTLSNKKQLLVVLDFPFVPLHNNAAELAARVQVRKRDISLHTMTDAGTKLQDAFMSIIQTCFQVGVNAHQYIKDRLDNKSDFYLPDVVLAKINTS